MVPDCKTRRGSPVGRVGHGQELVRAGAGAGMQAEARLWAVCHISH